MNPQFRMPWAPTGAPNQMMPMPQVGAMPPMGMGGMQLPMPGSFGPPQVGGQFNQPQNRVFPKQPQPPRNN